MKKLRQYLVSSLLTLILAFSPLITLLLAPIVKVRASANGTTTKVSVNDSGVGGDKGSNIPGISENGTFVVFYSHATNLVPNDTNGKEDIFLHNKLTSTTKRISVDSQGGQSNGSSFGQGISGDGRYVVFGSYATNLVSNDTNSSSDIFLYDQQNGETSLISVASDGLQANGPSSWPAISANGRFVAFESQASNLVSGDTNNHPDIFLRDLVNGTTTRVSVNEYGDQGNSASYRPSISADGRYITFHSYSVNLHYSSDPFPCDCNSHFDVFLRDTQNSTTKLISLDSSGVNSANSGSYNPSISSDGQRISYRSLATNLVADDTNGVMDIFLRDVSSSTTKRLSVGNGNIQSNHQSQYSAISGDGNYVVISSDASNLVTGDVNNTADVFIYDVSSSTIKRLSETVEGVGGDRVSYYPEINFDGSHVTYASYASNLVPNDTNNDADILLYYSPIDTVSPIVVGSPGRSPDFSDWHNADVTIDWQSTDPTPSSGTPTDPPDTLAALEGENTYTSDQSCDPAGNCATGSLTLKLDKTAPSLGTETWTNNPKLPNESTTLTVPANDATSGILGGEYFIGTDPGEGSGATLQWDGTNLSIDFGTDLQPGTYQIGIRARDNAGNWSVVKTVELVVQDPTAPSVTYSIPAPTGDNGWYVSPETLSWTVEDLESAITNQTGCDEFVLDTDTTGVTKTCEATSAGGTSSETVTLKYDATAPTVGTPIWNENPQAIGNDATVIVPVNDATSGVIAGEYFISSDPGQGSATSMTLTDGNLSATLGASLPLGDHTVSIRARDEAGNWSNLTTTTLTIEDRTAPELTYELSSQPNAAGWHSSPVTVTWTVTDPESAITESFGCETFTVSEDTASLVLSCTATSAGGTATVLAEIKYDATAPVLGEPVWAANPVTIGNDTSFSVPATDSTSSVSTGEYFLGTDPGIGNATALTWDGTNFMSNSFGAALAPGVYDIGIRAQDTAGNWSATQIVYLVVFDPAGPGYIVGQQSLSPGADDILPWISTDPKDFATFGFNVEFTDTGTVDASSQFNFNYVEKGACKGTNNCHSFVLNATSFDWLAIGGTNNSEGTFQGNASLEIDGKVSTVIFRVEAVDGNLLTPTENDHFVLKVWSSGGDLQSAPQYQITADFTPTTGNANGGVQIKK